MWWEKRRSAALSSACSADGCNQVLSARPVGRTAGNRLNGGGSRQSTAGRPEGGAARPCSAGGVCRIRSRARAKGPQRPASRGELGWVIPGSPG